MKLREILRKIRPNLDTPCDHADVRLMPVVAEIRGTGAGDAYRVEGLGRYWCEICGTELGSGNFTATLTARLELAVDESAGLPPMDPPLGRPGGRRP